MKELEVYDFKDYRGKAQPYFAKEDVIERVAWLKERKPMNFDKLICDICKRRPLIIFSKDFGEPKYCYECLIDLAFGSGSGSGYGNGSVLVLDMATALVLVLVLVLVLAMAMAMTNIEEATWLLWMLCLIVWHIRSLRTLTK